MYNIFNKFEFTNNKGKLHVKIPNGEPVLSLITYGIFYYNTVTELLIVFPRSLKEVSTMDSRPSQKPSKDYPSSIFRVPNTYEEFREYLVTHWMTTSNK